MLQNLNEEPIMYLKRQNALLKLFEQKAKPILNKLHDELNQYDDLFTVKEIDGNRFNFSLWGLNFIVKTEILNNKDFHFFKSGELNIYHLNNEKEEIITSFSFDENGVIEGHYLFDDYSLTYFRLFINKFIDYAQANYIVFQL